MDILEVLKEKYANGLYMGGFYSPVCGKCRASIDESMGKITMSYEPNGVILLNRDGKEAFNDGGECLIFPSKEMRDWDKFAWKNCDVLFSPYNSNLVIFDKFCDDTYTTFIGYEVDNNKKGQEERKYLTDEYALLSNEIKNYRFERNSLKPFDKVIGRVGKSKWYIDFFSLYDHKDSEKPYKCMMSSYSEIVKYDENTAKLIGTKDSLTCLFAK